jgi:3',5'-cyclic AMP phosphodiesterase CpdA
MKLAWATDIHLDFVGPEGAERFFAEIAGSGADGVLLSGDIATARSVVPYVRRMGEFLDRPVWFVLGNHDFYGGSIAAVREGAARLSEGGEVVWLGAAEVVELGPATGLVGHDGWGDARLGDHAGSGVLLNDFFQIAELVGLDKAALGDRLARLGDESAAHLARALAAALPRFEHVLVLTHVPPFREACVHRGQISDDEWLPYFACQAVGDVLVEAASAWPDRRLTVLCGHTHSGGECRPLPNLRILTGAAVYGRPAVQEPLLEV